MTVGPPKAGPAVFGSGRSVEPVGRDERMPAAVDRAPVLDEGILEPCFVGEVGVIALDDLQGAFVEIGNVAEQGEVGGNGGPVGVFDLGRVLDLFEAA